MASKLEQWVGAQGCTSPMITCVLSGTKQGEGYTTRLRLWSCSLAEQNRQRLPNLLWASILKWLGHRKLNLTLLTRGPPTTSCLNTHPHQLSMLTPDAPWQPQGWFTYSDMVTEDGSAEDVAGHSREWKESQEEFCDQWKKIKNGEKIWRLLLYCFPVLWGDDRKAAMQLANFKPINSEHTTGSLFWLLGSHESRDLWHYVLVIFLEEENSYVAQVLHYPTSCILSNK